jgi:hypothetical protein
MTERSSYYGAVADPGLLADHRAQVASEQQARMAERQQQMALLSSPLSSADERIRLWQKLHALALPRSPTHKLLSIIARQTEMALAQVLEVQQRRFAPVPANSGV